MEVVHFRDIRFWIYSLLLLFNISFQSRVHGAQNISSVIMVGGGRGENMDFNINLRSVVNLLTQKFSFLNLNFIALFYIL